MDDADDGDRVTRAVNAGGGIGSIDPSGRLLCLVLGSAWHTGQLVDGLIGTGRKCVRLRSPTTMWCCKARSDAELAEFRASSLAMHSCREWRHVVTVFYMVHCPRCLHAKWQSSGAQTRSGGGFDGWWGSGCSNDLGSCFRKLCILVCIAV